MCEIVVLKIKLFYLVAKGNVFWSVSKELLKYFHMFSGALHFTS